MSLQPTPDDPLDAFVYPWSYKWTKTFKPRDLGTIGKPLDKLTIEGKPKMLLRVRGNEKPFDIAEHRRNLRTQLLNAKATRLENKLDDVLAQNEIEKRYAKQQEELRRLENMFQSGMLGNIVNNVGNLARQQFQSDYFNNDPDVNSFDAETKRVMDLTKTIQRNTEELDKTRDALKRNIQDVSNELRTNISVASTAEELESLANFTAELEGLRREADELRQLEPEPFDIESDTISEDDLIRRVAVLEQQQQEADALVDRSEELEARTPVVGANIRNPETRATIERFISQGQELVEEIERFREGNAWVDLPQNIRTTMEYFSSPRTIGTRPSVENRVSRLRNFLREIRDEPPTQRRITEFM